MTGGLSIDLFTETPKNKYLPKLHPKNKSPTVTNQNNKSCIAIYKIFNPKKIQKLTAPEK